MDEPYSPRQKSGLFKFGSGQNHLDDSKLGSVLSTSGGGSSSPCTRGKTMRDFEGELAHLRQENFELKMKIYVLEEQKNCLQDEKDVTQLRLCQQALQKELEKVKDELAEKEDLIFKAGEAMMLMSRKHEEDLTGLRVQASQELDRYKETISLLEQEIMDLKEKSMFTPQTAMFEDSSAMYAVAFNLPGKTPKKALPDAPIAELENKILDLEDRLREKSTEVDDLTTKSSSLKLEADQLRAAEANLKAELEFRVQKLSDALSSLASAEKQIRDLKSKIGDSNQPSQNIPSDYNQLNDQYSACKTENQKLQKQVVKLHQRITELEKCNSVELHKKVDSLIIENASLKDRLSEMKEESKKDEDGADRSEAKSNDDATARVQELEAELERARMELSEAKAERSKTLKTIQAFVKQNRALSRDIERLQQQQQQHRDDPISTNKSSPDSGDANPELKKEAEDTSLRDFDDLEKIDFDCDDPQKVYLYSALKAKRQQVDQLNEKLRKRTIDLQELVNKELWSKNKEIEKLNRVCEKQVRDWSEQRTKLKGQEAEMKLLHEEINRLKEKLEKTVSGSVGQLVESSPSSEEGLSLKFELERLKCQLEEEVRKNSELEERCERLRNESEGWEKSRKDLVNACCLLTTRLEEISSFLESLLPSLAGRKRRLVKEAIDMSREVSKSLSLSCLEDSLLQSSVTMAAVSLPILPDVSQVDFNSEEDPEDSLLPSSEALDEHKNEVLRIRTQMDSLVERLKDNSPDKKANSETQRLQLRPWSLSSTLQERKEFSPRVFDESIIFGEGIPAINLEDITEGSGLESFTTDSEIKVIPEEVSPKKDTARSGLCPGSESEGWSEPDRTVSMARIGLKEEAPVPVREVRSDSSESPGKSNNSSVKKRRDSEIKSLQMKIKSLELTIDRLVSEKDKKSDEKNVSVDSQLLGENTLTQNLMAGLMDQREKLMLSLNQNDMIRHKIEEALSSAPSSPTKSDNEKSKSFNSNLIQQVIKMTDKLEESCSLCLQLETRCTQVEKEKLSLAQLLSAAEDKANSLSSELNGLRCQMKEKENDLLEKQCSLLELKNNVIILESKVKLSQEEATKQAKLCEALTSEGEAKVNELKEKWEKERADLINYYENEICILKMRVKELEVESERALAEAEKERGERQLMEGEVKIRLDRLEREKRETSERSSELEASLKESHGERADLQARLTEEMSRAADIEAAAKEVKSELERRVTELEGANRELESRLTVLGRSESAPSSPRTDYKRQRSNPTSDYTSDHEHHNNVWFPVCGRNNNNSSPDLGIESDNRMSSLEHPPLSSPKSNGGERGGEAVGTGSLGGRRLEEENSELRAQLARTRSALEETLAQLSSANQRKRQVEKAICRQLHKTHDILQKARLNLEPSDKHHL